MYKRKMQEIEELNQQSEVRKFYRAVDKMKRGFEPRVECCKDKNGELILEEKRILRRWVEHFRVILNREEDREERRYNIPVEGRDGDGGMVHEPTIEEVEFVVGRMSNNRAPGEDEVISELIKVGGANLLAAMHTLIVMVWETETMPRHGNPG